MSRDMIADLLTTLRTSTNVAVRQNAFDLLCKLKEDGVRGAKGALEAIERNKLMEFSSSSRKANSRRSRTGTQERRLSNGRMAN
jgi:hypothetical protein